MLLLLWLNYTSLKLPAQVSLFTSAVRRYPIHNWHHHSPHQCKDSMYKGNDKTRHSEPTTMRPNVDPMALSAVKCQQRFLEYIKLELHEPVDYTHNSFA